MAADRSVVYRLRADVTQFKAQMATAAASVKGAADKMTAADKDSAKFRRGLDTLGGAAGKVGLVAAVGLGAAVVKAANFDAAMSKVAASTRESTGNMELLRKAALKAGQDTVYSATEAADGIEQLAKAGVSTSDILGGGLRGALDLAAAGNQSVGDAAETAATAMTQFGLSGAQIPHIADLLAAGAGKAQGEVSDLAAALKQGGLVAAQMGLSIEDTTGTLAAFASAGLVGSDAGTSFKSMIQRLQNPLGQGAKAMKDLGINAYDAQGNFVGITDIAGQLQTKLGGLTQAQRDAALAQIFGSDAVRAASVLYQQGASGIQSWIDKTNDAGFATETAATKLDNLKGDLEQLGGSLETALIGTGSGTQGPLRGLVQSLTDVVNAYNKLPQGAQSAAGAALGLTAAVGGGIFVFSKVVQGIASTREAMDALGITSGKTGAAMSALGRGATIAGAALAGLAVIDVLQSGFGKAAPGIEAVTKSLLGLDAASSLPKNLEGIADSIDRIANPNQAQKLQEGVAGIIGFGGDSKFAEAKGQIEALDGALANLVTSAGPDAAATALDNLTSSANLSKSEIGDLKSLLPGYKEALAGSANDAQLAASGQGVLASSTNKVAAAARASTAAIQANVDAMRKQRQAAIAAGNSAIAYEAAIDDARAAAKENGRTLDITTEKGRANRTALLNLASAWNNQSNAAKSARGAHKAAISSFVQVAAQMGMNAGAARRYAQRLFEIPPKRVTQIQVNGINQQISEVRRLQLAIAAVRSKSVTIETVIRRRASGNSMGLPTAGADGMTVPGARHPYGDKVFAFLAPGEEVITNRRGEADRFRADRAAGRIPAYANGGTAQRFASGGSVGARGRNDDGTNTLRDRIRRLNAELARSTKAIEKERTARDDLVSKRDELASTVSGAFTTDLFGSQPDNLRLMNAEQRQAALTGGVFSTLKADIAGANTFKATLSALSKRGLDGQSFAALAASGDVNRAQAFANMSNADLASYKALFNERARSATVVGTTAGNAAFGSQIAVQVKLMQATQAEIKGLRADIKRAQNRPRTINVQDRSRNPRQTAKEVARLERLRG